MTTVSIHCSTVIVQYVTDSSGNNVVINALADAASPTPISGRIYNAVPSNPYIAQTINFTLRLEFAYYDYTLVLKCGAVTTGALITPNFSFMATLQLYLELGVLSEDVTIPPFSDTSGKECSVL